MKITPIFDQTCAEKEAGMCYEIDSENPGSVVWLSSGVHGDEIGPQKAIKKLLSDIQSGNFILERGKLILVPEGNPFAVKQNVRSVENRNLNRMFGTLDDFEIESPEAVRVEFLKKLIEDYKPEIILDLHSMSGETQVPFLYSPIKEVSIASKLGVGYVVSGWAKLSEEAIKRGLRAMKLGLADYGNRLGIPSFTLEAGTHDSPSSEANATAFIQNILSLYAFSKNCKFQVIGNEEEKMIIIEMTEAYFCNEKSDPKTSFEYKIHPVNFQKIPAGTYIADDTDVPVIVEYDAILVQPTTPEAMVPGNEAFFLGKIVGE